MEIVDLVLQRADPLTAFLVVATWATVIGKVRRVTRVVAILRRGHVEGIEAHRALSDDLLPHTVDEVKP